MTDIILPYRNTGTQDIIYALRSYHRYLQGYGRLVIIGDAHPGITPDIYIPMTDLIGAKHKEWNMFWKTLVACEHDDLTPDVWYTNDDFFLLQSCDAATFPLHHKGPLVPRGNNTPYAKTIRNTLRALGDDVVNYDTHAPMVINRAQFCDLEAADDGAWGKDYGLCMKTWYAYGAGITGTYYEDMKLVYLHAAEELYGRQYFSTDDKAWRWCGPMMESLYPDKSKWEK